MAILSWGKPKVECIITTTGTAPTTGTWIVMPDIKEGTAKLNTTKGSKTEAKAEGGAVVDVRYAVNAYTFECECFVKKSGSKPLTDADGLIAGNYSMRLTPEDVTLEGFLLDNCNVSCEESWSSADGKFWKYTFEALKPTTGNILKTYTQA